MLKKFPAGKPWFGLRRLLHAQPVNHGSPAGRPPSKDMIIKVANDLGAGKGDRIEISIPSGSFLMLSLLVYILPVAALIAGAFAGGSVARALHMNLTLATLCAGGGMGTALVFERS